MRRFLMTFVVAVLGVAAILAGTPASAGALTSVTGPNGTWDKAEEVPGTAALNKGGNAQIDSVSCASAGNCSAGGFYTGNSGSYQAFVASQVNGAWGQAEETPGTAALNKDGDAAVNSLSCGAAGNCSAGGSYTDSAGHFQAFVASQVNGAWGKAEEVPGTATLNAGGAAEIDSVSCASAGNCSAGGFYESSSNPPPEGTSQAFVVTEASNT